MKQIIRFALLSLLLTACSESNPNTPEETQELSSSSETSNNSDDKADEDQWIKDGDWDWDWDWDNKDTQDDSTLDSISVNGIQRYYKLIIPDNYKGSEEYKLLYLFHGFGGEVNYFTEETGTDSLQSDNNLILVYPQGSLSEGSPHWNAAAPGGDNKSSADDLGFFKKLNEKILSEYNIDSNDVNVGGYSNGAMMSYYLACQTDLNIASVVAVSGALLQINNQDCPNQNAPSLLLIHGTNDSVLSYEENEYFFGIPNTMDFWRSLIGVDTSKVVEHIRIEDGYHVWFKGLINDSDINQNIWRFITNY